MLKRKQYYFSLLIGAVAFLLFFIGAYLIVSLQMPKPEAGTAVTKNEQSTNTLVEVKEEVPRIEIYTKITVQTVDEGHKVVDKVIIPATTLLGMDEQNIRRRFEGYEILKFNEKEVTLQKEVKSFEGNGEMTYKLGINSAGSVCIMEEGNTESFVDLGIAAATKYSPETYSMLVQGKIQVSEAKREALLQNPNELDKILEAYAEANK